MIPPGETRFELRAPSIPVYRCLDSQQRSRFHVKQTYGEAMNHLVRSRKEIICKVRSRRSVTGCQFALPTYAKGVKDRAFFAQNRPKNWLFQGPNLTTRENLGAKGFQQALISNGLQIICKVPGGNLYPGGV
jgi:hypothetical protein